MTIRGVRPFDDDEEADEGFELHVGVHDPEELLEDFAEQALAEEERLEIEQEARAQPRDERPAARPSRGVPG